MERRRFLKGLGIAGVTLSAPATLALAEKPASGRVDLANSTLTGRVHSNGNAIAGVA